MAVTRSASGVAMESVFSCNVNANDAAWTWAAGAWAFPNACSCLHFSLPWRLENAWSRVPEQIYGFKNYRLCVQCVRVCVCVCVNTSPA